jgi:SAM-dependent methyltransferase
MAYDPDTYWQNRGGESYREYTVNPAYQIYRDAQEEFFTGLIARLKPQSLLDFACGTGKLFPRWTGVPEVDAYDRALSQIEVARHEAVRVRPERPYRVMRCLTDSRTELPYDDEQFDLVIAAEVFLHVLPTDIRALFEELKRVCRGHLALVTAAPFDNPAPHCFNHDYPALLAGIFDMTVDFERHHQRYIVATRVATAELQAHPSGIAMEAAANAIFTS